MAAAPPRPVPPPSPADGPEGGARLARLQRLTQMGLAEIAGRTRQEAFRWWDRVRADRGRGAVVAGRADGARRLEVFREAAPARFFAGAADERTPSLLGGLLPQEARQTVAGAERTLAGRFDLLGYRGLRFGDPIDWHLDPVSGHRSPLVHASRLDPLDAATVGDSKVVWELGRHQWLVELGQAYRLTGDERYAQGMAAHVVAWLEANPVGWGIHWTSSLELAMRLMAWCWALVLLRRSPALRPELFAQMVDAIGAHAAYVERYLSHYFSPNTHLTGEALGLFYVGTVFPDLRGSRRWRDRGAEILVREIGRQVLPDGVYFEQSTCYQRYTVEIALHLLVLSARVGFSLPAIVGERAQALLDFLLSVRSPRGEVPQTGDSDGGWLLPLARRRPDDVRGIFGTAAALFGRADYAWAAGGAVPEVLWMLGPAGLADFDALAPAPPDRRPSRLFADGGYAVMRDGWGPEGHHLIFDVGPLGCPVSGGHGHADLLAVQCCAFGEPFLVDPGTGTYAEEPWRRFFRGTAAHSTVRVDGASQAAPAGPFGWQQQPRARLLRWVSTDELDFADAEHDAYARLRDPVRHRRRILFVKGRYWVLVDDLAGAERHDVELRFQFGRVAVEPGPGSWTRAHAGARALFVRAFATVPLGTEVRCGALHPIEGWLSPDYGRREPAPAVVYSAAALLPLRIVTLLLPTACPTAPPPEVRPLLREGELVGLVFEATQEAVSIEADGLVVRSLPPAVRS